MRLRVAEQQLGEAKSEQETLNGIVSGYQIKNKGIKQKYFKAYDQMLKGPNADYKMLIQFFFEKLESYFECPLSYEDIKMPAILPSGVTIEGEFCRQLVQRGKTDPFDRTKVIREGKLWIWILEDFHRIKTWLTNHS